jgi:hypothetical protein
LSPKILAQGRSSVATDFARIRSRGKPERQDRDRLHAEPKDEAC